MTNEVKHAKPLVCCFKIQWRLLHICTQLFRVYLLVAAAVAAVAAAEPPAWADGGTAVPPGRRQQGRWLSERRNR